MKLAIYARVSTNKQETENQLVELRQFTEKQGWTVADEFVDTASGSGKVERPAFDRMACILRVTGNPLFSVTYGPSN